MTACLAALDRAVMPFVAGGAAVLVWLLLGKSVGGWMDRRRARADEIRRRLYLDATPRLWVYGAPGIAVATVLLLGLLGAWIPGLVLALLAWFGIESLPKRALRRRKQKFEAQLVDALLGLSNSLKAGMSLPQAVEQVSNDMPAPVSQEFGHILQEYNHGKTIDQAFEDAGQRIESRNYDLATLAFRVGKQRGGNLSEVFEKIGGSIREIWRLEEHIRTVSTEGRSNARFMTAMPPLFLVLLWFMDSQSMTLLFTDPIGMAILSFVVILNVLGHVWIRRILDVDV